MTKGCQATILRIRQLISFFDKGKANQLASTLVCHEMINHFTSKNKYGTIIKMSDEDSDEGCRTPKRQFDAEKDYDG